MIAISGRSDAGAFLARALRLDPAALVRVRSADPGLVRLWTMLPFRVLASRAVHGDVSGDVTVSAAALLAWLDRADAPEPANLDRQWRGSLPPSASTAVERIPVVQVRQIAAAAAATLRTARVEGLHGRSVGERVLRDALLDHVPISVTGPDGALTQVPQRMVQGLVRMGFVGDPAASSIAITQGESLITVRRAGFWIGLVAAYGSVWYRPI